MYIKIYIFQIISSYKKNIFRLLKVKNYIFSIIMIQKLDYNNVYLKIQNFF